MKHAPRIAATLVLLLLLGIGSADDSAPRTVPSEVTEGASKSIEKGLNYLARTQQVTGAWNSSAPVATTSIVCLAMLASGSTVSRGPFSEHVRRGLEFLLSRANRSGFIQDAGNGSSGMHGHGFATMTLAEALGTIEDRELYDRVQEALQKAVRRIEQTQNRFGGWNSSPDPSLSDDGSGAVAIMQIMALRSARADGLSVRHDVIEKAKKYVLEMTTTDGWYQYNWNARGGRQSCGLTGPGIYMIGALGQYDSPKYEAGIRNIMQSAPFLGGRLASADQGWQGWFYYALFYSALAIFQHGGDEWGKFYPAMRDDLIHKQGSDGAWEDPYGGLYTAFALLSLELPYRQLPLFQDGGRGREGG